MSEQIFQWLDVDALEVLERWYTTGLAYAGENGNVRMVGHRLAQACLELKDTDEVAKFWISFPFFTHDLNYTHWENRLNILDRALENPEFNAWFQAGLDKERKGLLIRSWTLLGEYLNSLDMAWSNRSEKADRPQLAKICTELWMELYPAGMHEHFARSEQWMRSAPRHPHTRGVVEETIAAHRRDTLADLVPPIPARAKTRGRMF